MPDPALSREDKSVTETDSNISTDRLALTEDFTSADGTVGGAATNTFVADRYRLVRMHARGGLGQVSVAIDEQFQRPVALKQIQARWLPEADVRRRFEREAEITGKLEHPGIVPVYSRGVTAEGEPYYAMRFIAGESLDEAIKTYHAGGRDRFQLRKLLRRFVDVCNTLQYAHDQGVIHRDIKPQNIMLGPYGETLVVDWGLAKVTNAQQDPSTSSASDRDGEPTAWQSQDGDMLGTPLYMSPEQCQAADAVGPQADVYSLGVTLYQLLTGTPPLTGLSREELFAKLKRGDLPRLRERDSSIPRPLEAICLRALALEPTNRYVSAAALAEEIERWLADEPVAAHRESWGERAARLARRHRSWVTAGGIALGLVALAAIVATVLVDQSRRQAVSLANRNADLANRNAALAQLESAAKKKAQQAERERRHEFAQAQFEAGRFALERGNWRNSIKLLQSALDAECDDPVAARLLQARAHYRLGQLEQTESLLNELAGAELGSHRGEFLELNAIYRAFSTNDEQETRSRLEQALAAPELTAAQRASMQGMLAQNFPEAIAALQEAVAANPYAYEARNMLTTLLIVSSRHQEAREQLDAARLLAPEDDLIPLGYALHFEMAGNRPAADEQLARLRQRISSSDFALIQSLLKTMRITLSALRGNDGESAGTQVTTLLWNLPTAVKELLSFDRPSRQALTRAGHHPAMREFVRRLTSNAWTAFLPSAAKNRAHALAEVLPDGLFLLGIAVEELKEIDVINLVKQGKITEAQERLHVVEALIIDAQKQPSLAPKFARAALFKLIDVRILLVAPAIRLPADPERRQLLVENLREFVRLYPEMQDYEASSLMVAARITDQHDVGRYVASQWERTNASKVPPLEARMDLELRVLDPWHARIAAEKILALKPDHPEAKEVLQLTTAVLRRELAKLVPQDAEPANVKQEEGR